MTKKDNSVVPVRSIVIVGRDNLQNRLLAETIARHTAYSYLIRPLGELRDVAGMQEALALLDIESKDATEIETGLQALSQNPVYDSIALINAEESVSLDYLMAWPKIKGIFFHDTSQENLFKGIQAIFNDECWLPRKMLIAYLDQTRSQPRSHGTPIAHLTKKEVETLKLLATGNSNNLIAEKLNVSPHTVKTHIYNVFRKINVNNRVQAVQWALQNIKDMDIHSQ